MVYTFIIAILAFASFRQNVIIGESIFFNVFASFVFGFGSDRVIDLAKAFPWTSGQPPSQVTGLVPTPSAQRIDLTWNLNSETDLDRYNIYRETSAGVLDQNSTVKHISNTNSFSDTGLKTLTPYYYRVATVDKNQ